MFAELKSFERDALRPTETVVRRFHFVDAQHASAMLAPRTPQTDAVTSLPLQTSSSGDVGLVASVLGSIEATLAARSGDSLLPPAVAPVARADSSSAAPIGCCVFSPPSLSPPLPLPAPPRRRLVASAAATHGRLGINQTWAAPCLVAESDELARAGYDERTLAHEYMDEPDVLHAKVKVLAALVRQSVRFCAYTGAGISTASGIGDYASHSKDTLSATAPRLTSPYDAQPTLAHRVLTHMHRALLLKHWIQQNHDGLPQKAGYPQHALNEIHGAWYDPSNPVVAMDGRLRSDLFEALEGWIESADLVLVLGTSLAGMNADRMATRAMRRANAPAAGDQSSLGAVIVSLQQTQHDEHAALRIFGTIDSVMQLLALELGLDLAAIRNEHAVRQLYAPAVPTSSRVHELEHVFWLPYDEAGNKLPAGAPLRVMDLREDATVKLTAGPHAGDEGIVVGVDALGHYRIQFRHNIGTRAGQNEFRAPMMRVLGSWFVEGGVSGALPTFPLATSAPPA